jgi:hypothetical protein
MVKCAFAYVPCFTSCESSHHLGGRGCLLTHGPPPLISQRNPLDPELGQILSSLAFWVQKKRNPGMATDWMLCSWLSIFTLPSNQIPPSVQIKWETDSTRWAFIPWSSQQCWAEILLHLLSSNPSFCFWIYRGWRVTFPVWLRGPAELYTADDVAG